MYKVQAIFCNHKKEILNEVTFGIESHVTVFVLFLQMKGFSVLLLLKTVLRFLIHKLVLCLLIKGLVLKLKLKLFEFLQASKLGN